VSKFLERALSKAEKMDQGQIRALLDQVAAENRRLESLLDSMTDGVLALDGEHRVSFYNKAAERLVPLTPGEPLEKPVWLAVADAEIAGYLKARLEADERIKEKEFALEGGSGTRIVAVSSMSLVRGGRMEGTILHIEDVTSRRAEESRLRRAENLASLTTLAAGMAHEIKNPLGSISIHLQLMQKAMRDKEEIEVQAIEHYLSVANEEIERLNRIVVDFLFAVRPMDLELEYVDLGRFLGDLIDFLHYELEEAGIELELDIERDLPDPRIDVRYFKQAVLNLVKNAIAAMEGGGRLAIRARRDADTIKISVEDTGKGIPEDILPKIFEPYFSTKENGLGLGLTLVYKIVREHSGEIQVSSKEGEGAKFEISLPVPQRERRLLGFEGGEE
jgi:PAS domain S-box-containing protein